MQKLTTQSSERELRNGGYKNGRMQLQVLPSSEESINSISERNKPSLALGMETKPERGRNRQMHIPTVSKGGRQLMPCRPSKARKLLEKGLAEKKWNKLGMFYIQLKFEPKSRINKGQKLCLGLDTGSQYDGLAIVSKSKVQLTGMLELPKNIVKKIEQKRQMRRARRRRNCRRREERFDNRKREGFIAPSQKAKVDFRIRIVEELMRLYPIKFFAVEDVRFNHYRKRWGKFFSTTEIGKTRLYDFLRLKGKLFLFSGVQTAKARDGYGIEKTSDKRKRSPHSHAVDAMVLAGKVLELKNYDIFTFFVCRRYQYCRRQLHKFQHEKGGKRRREGGTDSLYPFKKGDVVLYEKDLARVGGFKDNFLSLHNFDLDNKRFTQRANPKDCLKLFNQRIMSQFVPPMNGVGFLATNR